MIQASDSIRAQLLRLEVNSVHLHQQAWGRRWQQRPFGPGLHIWLYSTDYANSLSLWASVFPTMKWREKHLFYRALEKTWDEI